MRSDLFTKKLAKADFEQLAKHFVRKPCQDEGNKDNYQFAIIFQQSPCVNLSGSQEGECLEQKIETGEQKRTGACDPAKLWSCETKTNDMAK